MQPRSILVITITVNVDTSAQVSRNRASGPFHRPSAPISAADGGVTPLLPLAARVGLGVRSASVGRAGWVVVLRGPG